MVMMMLRSMSCMYKNGQFWKWPSQTDKTFYSREEVKKVIEPPKVPGSREQFLFVPFLLSTRYMRYQ